MVENAPDPQKLEAVETSLYNRMLKNAFIGFAKSAAIAAGIGLAVVGAAAAAAYAGVPMPFIKEAGSKLVSTVVSGGLNATMWFAGLAGSFGAVAGIQSTRDTRRFFMMHEGHEIVSPEETRSNAVVIHHVKNKDAGLINENARTDNLERLLVRQAAKAELDAKNPEEVRGR